MMSFQNMQWLFPIAVVLHEAEEAVWLPQWISGYGGHLPWRPGAPALRFTLAVQTLAAFALTYLSGKNGKQSVWAYLTFGSIVAALVNVFVPHLPASLLFRSYTPGVVTAVLVV